jgi:hypothetical protein
MRRRYMKYAVLLATFLVCSCSTTSIMDKPYGTTRLHLKGVVEKSSTWKKVVNQDTASEFETEFNEVQRKADYIAPRTTKIKLTKLDNKTKVSVRCLRSRLFWFARREQHREHKWIEQIEKAK